MGFPFSDHIALLEDCITRQLGFTVASKSMRIIANCDKLARTGKCEYRDREGELAVAGQQSR